MLCKIILFFQSTISNRHTSLYNRGDSSNQLPKHLLNISENMAKSAATNLATTNDSDIPANGNHKINEFTTKTDELSKVDVVDTGSPIICIK